MNQPENFDQEIETTSGEFAIVDAAALDDENPLSKKAIKFPAKHDTSVFRVKGDYDNNILRSVQVVPKTDENGEVEQQHPEHPNKGRSDVINDNSDLQNTVDEELGTGHDSSIERRLRKTRDGIHRLKRDSGEKGDTGSSVASPGDRVSAKQRVSGSSREGSQSPGQRKAARKGTRAAERQRKPLTSSELLNQSYSGTAEVMEEVEPTYSEVATKIINLVKENKNNTPTREIFEDIDDREYVLNVMRELLKRDINSDWVFESIQVINNMIKEEKAHQFESLVGSNLRQVLIGSIQKYMEEVDCTVITSDNINE